LLGELERRAEAISGELPDRFATCSTVLHEDDVQRLMMTKSRSFSVLNEEKERPMTPSEAISHVQFALFAYSDCPTEIVPELVPVDDWH
jgi:hypothetical protein